MVKVTHSNTCKGANAAGECEVPPQAVPEGGLSGASPRTLAKAWVEPKAASSRRLHMVILCVCLCPALINTPVMLDERPPT